MRIAQIVPRGEQPWSGILVVIVNLSAALARRGHHVEVCQLHHWPPDAYADPKATLESAGIVQSSLAGDVPWWRVGRAVAKFIHERDLRVVHLHGAFNPWNTLVAWSLPRPYVFSPHSGYDPVSLRRSRVRKYVYGHLLERRMVEGAALCVALTEVELSQLRAFGAGGPAEVIPNGVNSAPGPVDPLAFRAELGIAPEAPLAAFVGRLDVHRKGLDILLRGIAGAPGWHLALVGPRFRDVARLEAMIDALKIGDRVHLAGERHGHHLREALEAATVFVLLSRWEGLPMALLEALSRGKPSVVSPAVERLIGVQAAGAGWVADQTTLPLVLAEALRAGPEEVRRRRKACSLLARRYDWDAVARQYELAYERALRPETITGP